ncbi:MULTISPECIES: Sec-independent protein translocase protein TatB [Thalassospira]|uniref:TatABCE protein translocation system subunit n=2 Tax=Thalassospira TaxID=168934 RepID=A0A367VZ05_9PROT|nr:MULTISPECIES: Sec-independent protein translocase protein TatB [Thalassospira]MDG4721638.1 Sec-independent protein translocase protein TatB [Thalassospira sp. FZY0004]RCK31359.1 TatABCE protein translocation system subunit [Thalassospira profundimaris]
MFDIGWTEMALVALVALFVVGPKELPHLLYKLAGYWKKVRGMAREFQSGIDDIIREAELDDLRKQVSSAPTSGSDFLEKSIGAPKSSDKAKEGNTNTGDTKSAPKGDADKPVAKSDAGESKKNDHPESQA